MTEKNPNDVVDDKVAPKTDDQNKSVDDKTTDDDSSGDQKSVSKAEFDKVLAELHKHKKTARELDAKLKDEEKKALKEKQDWQKLAELNEKEANEARQQKELLTKAVVTDKKMSAIREAALKSGMLDSAIDDIDLLGWNDVQVETTSTGKINVIGADAAVKRLQTLKPHWFGKGATKVNGKIPDTNNPKSDIVTLENIVKLRKEAMQSGDYSVYEAAFKKFQAQ